MNVKCYTKSEKFVCVGGWVCVCVCEGVCVCKRERGSGREMPTLV